MKHNLSSTVYPHITRVVDIFIIVASGFLAISVKSLFLIPIEVEDWSIYISIIVFGALLFVFPAGELYESWRATSLTNLVKNILLRWLGLSLVILLVIFLLKSTSEISRGWFVLWVIFSALFLLTGRFILYGFLRSFRAMGYNHRHVVIIGSGQVAAQLIKRINTLSWCGYEIAECIDDISSLNVEHIEKNCVDEVWIAIPLANEDLIKRILHSLRHTAASIRYIPDLFALRLINHSSCEIMGMSMYSLAVSPLDGFNRYIKLLEDKILSAIILLLISPIMLILAIGVKYSSPGPVFYRQERVGLNNKNFNMLKFRSMPIDTERDIVKWGSSASKVNTKFSKFIRSTSLDELPQFINVLKGEMSIVGPRPERRIFVDQFKDEIPDYMKKHLVKAGITGWAQVNGWRGDTDLNARIEHDIYYIENWTLLFDLKIILMTVFKGFRNKNAY